MGEERITAKKIAASMLPQVTKMREDLDASLTSLQYLWIAVDKLPRYTMTVNSHALLHVKKTLERLEEELCLI